MAIKHTPLEDWENPEVSGINRETMHAPLGAYADAESARSCIWSPASVADARTCGGWNWPGRTESH